MIHNRHIRRDYAEGQDYAFAGRRKMMCGKRVTHKLSGIPSVTTQSMLVNTSVGIRPGWCLTCTYELVLHINAYLANEKWFETSAHTVYYQQLVRREALETMMRYFIAVPPPQREQPQDNGKFGSLLEDNGF